MKRFLSALSPLVFMGLITFGQTTLPIEDFEKKLSATANANLLDVRTTGEYQKGHLKNAKNIDFLNKETFAAQVQTLDKNQPVFVYCLSGGRSNGAMNYLVKNGFREVYNMQAGFAGWSEANKPFVTPVAEPTPAVAYTKEAFDKVLKDNALLVVDFYAPWCGPCQKMTPAVEKMKQEYAGKIMILKIDYDNSKALVQQYGVDEIPTLLFFKNTKLALRSLGYTDEEHLRKQIEDFRK